MSAPIKTDLVIYPGTNGTPADDVSAYGGAIDTTTPLDPNTLDIALYKVFLPAADTAYYSAYYFQNNCTTPGTLAVARVYNRSGARVNTSAGVCQYVSSLATDTGTVRTVGKVSGAWDHEDVALTGTTPAAGTKTWDATSVVRHEYLAAGPVSAKPTGQVTISNSGQILGVIYGTAADSTLATSWASAEFQFALATAKNITVEGTDRLHTISTGTISAFAYATYWSGEDNSLPVPGGELAFTENIAVVTKFMSYAGIPLPVSTQLNQFPAITGIPQ